MTYYMQVGLAYTDDRTISEKVNHPILLLADRHGFDYNSEPNIPTVYGPLVLKDHIKAWIFEYQVEYSMGHTKVQYHWDCRGFISFPKLNDALMFKLTFI